MAHEGSEVVTASFRPQQHHRAFEGVLCGGIIGSLLDCHCNWTAAWKLCRVQQRQTPPCTVTAEYNIKLRRPTPIALQLTLRAWVQRQQDQKVWVRGEMLAEEIVCATCEGLFVAVGPEHPAYNRW